MTWRVEWPAEVLGAKVAKIRGDEIDEILTHPNQSDSVPWAICVKTGDGKLHRLDTLASWTLFTRTRPSATAMWTEFPRHEGVAVFTRPGPMQSQLAKAMRVNGIRTVAEADDNYFSPANQNLTMRQAKFDDTLRLAHAKSFAQMDANVFSTAWLRDRYHREFRKLFGKTGLPPMHVCRNHIPSTYWPEQREREGPLRVGFMGSPSHVWDVNLAYAAFHAAKEYGCVTTMIGYNPGNPDPDTPDEIEWEGETYRLRSKKSVEVKERWAKVIEKHVRWIDPTLYHRTPLPLDIGLAPLLFNDFTSGKSDAKALEYTASGAACVLQNHPIYTSAGWQHEQNCLLAGSQEEMALATVRLIRDHGLRRSLVVAAQEMVREERNETAMLSEWREALGV